MCGYISLVYKCVLFYSLPHLLFQIDLFVNFYFTVGFYSEWVNTFCMLFPKIYFTQVKEKILCLEYFFRFILVASSNRPRVFRTRLLRKRFLQSINDRINAFHVIKH